MKVQSNSIVFVDTTDTKKIDVHIASNYPTVQIYNSANGGTYTPNWSSSTPLILKATVYADSTPVTNDAKFQWSEVRGFGSNEFKTVLDFQTNELTIPYNALSGTSIVRYECAVKYNSDTFDYSNIITFTRIDDGVAAPMVLAQYSADGSNGSWETTFDSSAHKYIHFSYDGGINWTEPPIRIVGEPGQDGQSITLKGVAYTSDTLTPGSVVDLYSDETIQNDSTKISGGESGDSYLVKGYLCVYNGSQFVCTGQIQGPQGQKGDSYYLFIRYADGPDGSGISQYPDGKSYIGFYRSLVNQVPTAVDSHTWNWAKFAGEDAKIITLTGNAQAFKVDKTNTISPREIKVTAQTENISAFTWSYSTDGGVNFSEIRPDWLEAPTNGSITIKGSRMPTNTNSISFRVSDGVRSDVFTVYKIYDGADGEVGPDGKPATTVFLSNEHIPFVANADGQVGATTATCNVVSYNGTTKVVPIIGAIVGLPSGMSIAPNRGTAYTYDELAIGNIVKLYSDTSYSVLIDTKSLKDGDTFVSGVYLCRYHKADDNFVCENVIIGDNNELKLTITVEDNATFGSVLSDNNSFRIPISEPVETTLWLNWSKINSGAKGENAMSFQLYAPKGYLITNDVPEVTLEAFAYDGGQLITDATFVWYSWNGETWDIISATTDTSLTLNKSNVFKSNVYKCNMTYQDKAYEATATVEDKTDVYESLIRVVAKQSSSNRMYWILYTTIYSEDGEHDALLGPISEVEPTNASMGDYWYKVDATNYSVTLMKYSGTAWETTTDTQELLYDWTLFKDTTDIVTLGSQGKVKIVTANDFSRVCNVQCNIFGTDYTLLSRNSQVLNDPSDPIISATEPPNPIDKQLWIRVADNGTYVISIWNEETKKWMVSDADSQNKVHTEKPVKYVAGDIWIVGGDYQPTIYIDGVAESTKYLIGTMLKAQSVSETYSDGDWVEALNYKENIDNLKDQLNIYNQYFSFDEDGIIMTAKNLSGEISEFKTKLTNTELGFYQGENKVAHINDNQLNISKAEITNGLTVTGTAPTLSIGGFSLVIESNGSLSIGYNT